MVVMVVFVTASGSDATTKNARFAEEKRMELNGMVNNYLTAFEDLRKDPEFKEFTETMGTMKMLMVQAWIYMLTPEKVELQGLVPIEDAEGVEFVKVKIISQLKEMNEKSPVSDAILHYVKNIIPKIQGALNKRMETLRNTIRELNEKETDETNEEKKQEFLAEADKKGDEFEDAVFLFEFENIATKMALQSYVFNFMNTLVITSSDKKEELEFNMPSLYQDSFEELLEEDEFDDHDDGGEDEITGEKKEKDKKE